MKTRKENFYNHKNGFGAGTDFILDAHTVDGKVVEFNIAYESGMATIPMMKLLADNLQAFADTIEETESEV